MGDNLARIPLAIGLLGPGLIGSAFLKQLESQAMKLLSEYRLDLHVVGIANSKRMLLQNSSIDIAQWTSAFQEQAVDMDLEAFIDHLKQVPAPYRVIIDCSSSEELSKQYISFIEAGFHIVTPNKKMGSGPLEDYLALRALARQRNLQWFTEATCGAGLPVISTLKSLIQTGDKILRIEGIFSGTLSYIFNNFGPGMPFSNVVATAQAKGYTEPDPRDDLSGMDVARKIVILARETGSHVELDDVSIQNLVPEALQGLDSPQDFMQQLPSYDDEMEKRALDAGENGEVLRYVAMLDGNTSKCRVELRNYLRSHPFAQLQGSDNIIMFTTERYYNQPLIVRGPGAGAEVTAAGVFADCLKLAECLGKPT